MQVSEKRELSTAQKQNVIFRLLKHVCDDILGGNQRKLAACLRVAPSSVSRWYSEQLCTVPPSGNDYQVIIHLLAVHKSLSAIFTNPLDRMAWFESSNLDLDGKSPEELIRSGLTGLIFVRQYLHNEKSVGA